MTFHKLQTLLIDHVRERVSDGHLTERGIARRAGISQPHIHLALRGDRNLSPTACDCLLQALELSVLDLLPADVLAAHTGRAVTVDCCEVDVLDGEIGPGCPLGAPVRGRLRFRRSAAQFDRMGWPVAARLAWDPELAEVLPGGTWVVLDQSAAARREWRNDGLYLIRCGPEGRIRRLRRAGNGLYMTVDRHITSPEHWQLVGELDSPGLDCVLARVWLAEPEGVGPGAASPAPLPAGGEWG